MRTAFCLAAGLAAAVLTSCKSDLTSLGDTGLADGQSLGTATGNGAPSGPHFNLNIIGVPKGKSANMNGAGGNVIFVNLGTPGTAVTSKILLFQSAAAGLFAVLDKNGTDGTASFELPAPGGYTVWARALAKPGGKATITTCVTDPADPTATICSTVNEVFVRGTGKSSFRNVTDALTTITFTALVGTCTTTTVNLFDPCLQGFLWQYDNSGLRLLQVRFYPNPA